MQVINFLAETFGNIGMFQYNKAFECYGKEVILDTSNGDITLENLKDKEFVIDKLRVSTSNAEENINANYKSKK